MSTNTRGAPDVIEAVRDDLRDYQPLVVLLPEPEAIYEGFPADDRDYDASVTLTAMSENTTAHRGVTERRYRVQATVTANRRWREWFDNRPNQPSSIGQMTRILRRVGERLDRAAAVSPEISTGGDGGPTPFELDDGRLAVVEDWLLAGWYDA